MPDRPTPPTGFAATRLYARSVALSVAAMIAFLSFTSSAAGQDETTKRTIKLTGTVIDASGRGVADATVVFLKSKQDHYNEARPLGPTYPFPFAARGGQLEPAGRTTAGAGGRFSFEMEVELDPASSHRHLWTGKTLYQLPVFATAFTRTGMASVWHRVPALPETRDHPDPIAIQLLPTAQLTVRVRDEADRPLAKTPIDVSDLSYILRLARLETARFEVTPLAFASHTNEAGDVTFTVPAGLDLRVIARDAWLFTHGSVTRAGTPYDALDLPTNTPPLRLAPGESRVLTMTQPRRVRVSGRVVVGGKPHAHAAVYSLGQKTKTDADGRYAFAEPLRAGALVNAVAERRILCARVPSDAPEADAVVDMQRADRSQGFRVTVTQANVDVAASITGAPALSVGPMRDAKATSADRPAGRTTAALDVWNHTVDVVVSPRSDSPTGPLGFHVARDVPVRDAATVDVPDIPHDAALTVAVRPQADATIDGEIYLAAVGVDRFPGVRVFTDRLVPAAATLTFPALQSGHYLLGYIPCGGVRGEPGGPDDDDVADWLWDRAFGRVARARGAHWRPVRVAAGANRVTLDLSEPTRGGVLEIEVFDREGNVVRDRMVQLSTRSREAASRSWRRFFAASPGGGDVIRIAGVRPGLYSARVSHAFDSTTIPVVIPSSGVHRMRVVLDAVLAFPPLPPLADDRSLAMSPSDVAGLLAVVTLQEVMGHYMKGERPEAQALAMTLYRERTSQGAGPLAMMALLGGMRMPSQPPVDAIAFSPDLAAALAEGKPPIAPATRAAALDVVWRAFRRSNAFRHSPPLNATGRAMRLDHLLRYYPKTADRAAEFTRILKALRASSELADEARFRAAVDAIESRAADWK